MSDIQEILNERGKRYGKFSDHADCTQSLKNTLARFMKGACTYSEQEALDMICHKLGRIACGDPSYIDSWVDIAGYATLIVNELKEEEEKRNEVR